MRILWRWLAGLGLVCLFWPLAQVQARTLPPYTFPSPAPIVYHDDVAAFTSDLTLNQNGTLTIKEMIDYRTTLQKHGIYRYIPYRYTRDGLTVSTQIRDIVVAGLDGQAIPFQQSWSNNNVELKIGDPDHTFTGQKTYLIRYTVTNVLLNPHDQPRLYWDIVGDGWKIPVHQVTATLHSPYAELNNVRCFGGQEKADDGVCTAQRLDQQTISLFYGHLIEYGDNVTLDTQLSTPNQLQLPSQSDQMAQTILDNLWIGLLALPLVVSWFVWFRWGRDWEFVRYNIFDHSDRAKKLRAPFSSRSPSLVYEPLDISPGLANAIMTERYTTRSLVGDIVDLAHQHFLKIEQIQEKSLFKAADYTFTKEGLSPDRLPAHQQLLLTKIFTKSDVIKLSALKGEFVSAFAEIQKKVHEMLWKDGYYTRNPAPAQGLTVVGFMLLAVTIGLLFASGHFIPFFDDTTMVIFIGLGIADFLAAMACALNLVQKTAKGSNYRMQAVGLRHTIQHGAWREKIMEKHLFFEDMLPFAIAFGVVDQLTKNMKDLNVEPPTYVGALNSSTFYAGSFAQSFTNDIGSNLTYNPSSSSWSGGGGGFSGGGGGGGGGGSW